MIDIDKIKTNAELKSKVIRASLILVASIVVIIALVAMTGNKEEETIVSQEPIESSRLDLIPGDTTSFERKSTIYQKMDWNDLKSEDELTILNEDAFGTRPEEPTIVQTVQKNQAEPMPSDIDAVIAERRRAREKHQNLSSSNSSRNYNPYGNRTDWEERYSNESNENDELAGYKTQREKGREEETKKSDLGRKKSNDPYDFDNLSEAEQRRVILTTGQAKYEESREISAMIMSSGTIRNGQTITLITKEPAILSLEKVPAGTAISGVVSFNENRLQVQFSTMRLKKKIIKIDLTLYGLDGIKGLPVSSDVFAREIEDTGVNEAISQGSSEAGTIGRVVGGLIRSKRQREDIKVDLGRDIMCILVNNKQDKN